MNIKDNLQKIKKGTYAHAKWRSVAVINGLECVKVSSGVVRVLGGAKESKAGIEYATLFLTHNSKLKTSREFFIDGVKVSQQEYENLIPPTKKEIDVCFAKHICDILEISNKRCLD